MSKSKTKTSNTSSTTSNSTSTPTVAPWLNSSYQNFGNQIDAYASTDPSKFVAGTNANLQGAYDKAGNLGAGQGLIDQGASIAGQVAGNKSTPGYTPGSVSAATIGQSDIDKFLNPYLQSVVDTTLADYDVDSGRTRASQAAQAAKNQAFGGSRFALREAQTEGELARGRATTDSGLRSSAYDKALAAAQQEAERRQQAAMASYAAGNTAGMFNAQQQSQGLDRSLNAAGILGNFGTAMGNEQRADLTAQAGAGQTQRDIENEQLQALPTWLQSIGQMYGSIPTGAFTSMNQTGSGTGQSKGTSTTTGASMSFNPMTGFSFGG